MKNRIRILIFYSLWAIVILFFFSCLPDLQVDPKVPEPGIGCAEDTDFPSGFRTLEEALNNIEFDEQPRLSVAVKSLTGATNEKQLLVYNPYGHSQNFYKSNEYSVYWFQDGNPAGQNIKINCVSTGEYAALVLNNKTKLGVGIDYYEIRVPDR